MARPLRIEFPNALYHITSRGNAQEDIYQDDIDRKEFISILNKCCKRFDWYCHAYCLMSNHYHLLIETGSPNLSKGMKYLNGTYTQKYNRTHNRVGHVYQGRFKSILVQKETYLLELARYIVLNPVRARMVRSAKDWKWSSYRSTAGLSKSEPCLTLDLLLSSFSKSKSMAQKKYREFVKEGRSHPGPWERLKNQIYLGSDEFVESMQCNLDPKQSLKDVPRKQKIAPAKPISYYQKKYTNAKEAMARAYLSGHYTQSEVGAAFGCSYATVSRAVKAIEETS